MLYSECSVKTNTCTQLRLVLYSPLNQTPLCYKALPTITYYTHIVELELQNVIRYWEAVYDTPIINATKKLKCSIQERGGSKGGETKKGSGQNKEVETHTTENLQVQLISYCTTYGCTHKYIDNEYAHTFIPVIIQEK